LEPARFDWRCKGLPARAEGLTGPEIGALGLSLTGGDMMMPVAVLREAALRNNIAAMQAFADGIGARLCPHGKTSMSPELFAMQIGAGAWGMSAATAHHVRVYRRWGVRRIFLANELVAPADIAWIAEALAAGPDFDFYCLVNSVEAVRRLSEARPRRPFQVLVETGFAGGRSGVRDVPAALAVARAAAAAPGVTLRGVETYEGIRQALPGARGEAAEMLALAIAAAEAIAREGLIGEGPLLLSAGGSAFLDLCAASLPAEIAGRPVETFIRPGCYVTHDHGLYADLVGLAAGGLPRLEPALEVWGAVQSLPEPGLAIVGLGKRDAGFDSGLPQPIRVHRPGVGERKAGGLRTLTLWDQHASLACPDGALAVRDLVGFGISHPCATFDRWRALFTVDGDDRVTGAVTTCF